MNIYACSDIHGQYRLFKKMLKDIRFSDDDLLYILGDIIDRGPESIPMLQDIMQRDNVMCLLGNHEFMMYTNYRYPEKDNSWLYSANGGTVTRADFEKLSTAEQEKILNFIGNMALQIDLTVEGEHFLLSHSDFIADKNSILFKDVSYHVATGTVWNSPWRTWEHVPKKKYKTDNRIHVIGHVPVQYLDENPSPGEAYVDLKNNIVNIDLGCAGIGKRKFAPGLGLCCMNLTVFAKEKSSTAFTYYY